MNINCKGVIFNLILKIIIIIYVIFLNVKKIKKKYVKEKKVII